MLYIHDHMKKNNMNEAAKVFAQEANLELKSGQYYLFIISKLIMCLLLHFVVMEHVFFFPF